MRRQVLMTRTAISPRLAIKILLNMRPEAPRTEKSCRVKPHLAACPCLPYRQGRMAGLVANRRLIKLAHTSKMAGGPGEMSKSHKWLRRIGVALAALVVVGGAGWVLVGPGR